MSKEKSILHTLKETAEKDGPLRGIAMIAYGIIDIFRKLIPRKHSLK